MQTVESCDSLNPPWSIPAIVWDKKLLGTIHFYGGGGAGRN